MCGYLAVLGALIGSRDWLVYLLLPLAGALFGGPFGLVIFPALFYPLLQDVPMRRALMALGYGTVIAAWIGSILVLPKPGDRTWIFMLKIYGPAAFGALAAALWVRTTPESFRLSNPARNVLIAAALIVLAVSYVTGVWRHP